MIETEWSCSCGEGEFESKVAAEAHTQKCFERGRIRSKPRPRKQWIYDTNTELPAEAEAGHSMVSLVKEGDPDAMRDAQEYINAVEKAARSAIRPEALEAPNMGWEAQGPVEKEYVNVIYIDGASPENGSRYALGGVGMYFVDCEEYSLAEPLRGPIQTNNRAEMMAGLQAIRKIEELKGTVTYSNQRFELCTDSEVLMKGLTGLLTTWYRNGWYTSGGNPVMNVDLTVEGNTDVVGGGTHDSRCKEGEGA